MSTTTHLTDTDDYRHATSPPLGRESLAFVIPLPDEGLGLIAYTHVDHANVAGRALLLWNAEGLIATEVSDPVAGDGRDFDDWEVAGLELAHTDPLQAFALSYSGDRLDLDLRFEARHRAFAYGEHPEGCPPWLADDRFEQHGNLQGSLRFEGRDISLDGRVLFRDHSWGTRDWQGALHWKWIHLAAGDRSVHVMELWHGGRRTTPGYVYRDGELSPVTDFQVDELDLGPDYFHRSIAATVRDAAGRETPIVATSQATALFPAHPAIRLHEATAWCEIDGVAGHGHVELMWPAEYADHHATTS